MEHTYSAQGVCSIVKRGAFALFSFVRSNYGVKALIITPYKREELLESHRVRV